MAKTIKPNSFFKTFQFLFLSSLLMGNSFSSLATPLPNELPGGASVQAGNVSFNQNGNILDVNSSSNRAIVNYQSFNIGKDAIVNFNLPGASSAILNRVLSGSVSEIFGQLNSNGRVFLVNPSGILFGSGSQINVNSLFASTLNISNSDFLIGNYVFGNPVGTAPDSITNKGSLISQSGGMINLFAGAIDNQGSIVSPSGQINLAVGDQISFVNNGLGFQVVVDQALKDKVVGFNTAISNSGSLKADGGLIRLQTDLTNNLYDLAVNNSGVVQANSLASDDGYVELVTDDSLSSNNNGHVLNSGSIASSGNTYLQVSTLENSGSISSGADVNILALGLRTITRNDPDGTLIHYPWGDKDWTMGDRPAQSISFSILNNPNSSISAGNDLNIIAKNIYNTSGTLEAVRDLNFQADFLINERAGFYTEHIPTRWGIDNFSPFLPLWEESNDFARYEYWLDRQSPLQPGTLTSGRDINLLVKNTLNQDSLIESARDLNVKGDNFTNSSKILMGTQLHIWRANGSKRYYEPPAPVLGQNNSSSVLVGGNANFDLNGNFNNSSIVSVTGDLAVKANNANIGILNNTVQTPQVTRLPSTLLLPFWEDIPFDSDKNILGPFRDIVGREIKNILFNLTGKTYLGNEYKTAKDTLAELEANRKLAMLKDPTLTWGEELTQEQIANLDSPILWYQIGADGKGRLVVYIPDSYRSTNSPEGLTTAENISFDIQNKFQNTGTIIANNNLDVNANEIVNEARTVTREQSVRVNTGLFRGHSEKVYYQEIQRGGNLVGNNINLNASKSITNRGGNIVANETVSLSAPLISNEAQRGSQVVTWKSTFADKLLGNKNTYSIKPVFQGAGITGKDVLISGDTVQNIGSDIFGQDLVSIKATDSFTNSWLTGTYTTKDNFSLSFKPTSLSLNKDMTTAHVIQGASVGSGGDVEIQTNTFNNVAADVYAGHDINVQANNINITDATVKSTDKHSSLMFKTSLPATSSINYSDTKSTHSSHQSSNFVAGNDINLNADNNLSITGSNAYAGNKISLSGKDVTIQNGLYADTSNTKGGSASVGVGVGTINFNASMFKSDGKFETLTPSSLLAKDIEINGSNHVGIKASDLTASNSIEITTPKLDITGEYERQQFSTTSNGVGVSITLPQFAAAAAVLNTALNTVVSKVAPNQAASGGAKGGIGVSYSHSSSHDNSGRYVESNLNAPALTLNSPNQNIDGAVINGQEINPSGNHDYHDKGSFSFSAGVGTNGINGSIGFNDFTVGTGIGGQGLFGVVGYRQFTLGTSLKLGENPLNSSSMNHLSLFGSAYGLGGSVGVSTIAEHPNLIDAGLSYGPLALGGSMQGGELKSSSFTFFNKTLDITNPLPVDYTCFKAGTPITLADGSTKAIEEVRKGDKVLSWNEKTGKLESKAVLNVFRKNTKQIVQIQLSNKLIETTPDHPFYTKSRGWVEAGKLNINDKLFDEEHKLVSIVSLKTVDEIVPVYNLEIEDNHTYFAHGILVHNVTCLVAKMPDGSYLVGTTDSKTKLADYTEGENGQSGDLYKVDGNALTNPSPKDAVPTLGFNPALSPDEQQYLREHGKLMNLVYEQDTGNLRKVINPDYTYVSEYTFLPPQYGEILATWRPAALYAGDKMEVLFGSIVIGATATIATSEIPPAAPFVGAAAAGTYSGARNNLIDQNRQIAQTIGWNSFQEVNSSEILINGGAGFLLGIATEGIFSVGGSFFSGSIFSRSAENLLESSTSEVIATGQGHHLLSKKIVGQLDDHSVLKGVFDREDPRFLYNALDDSAHRGYQTWHREYDQTVVKWLQNNPEATPQMFEDYLHNLHQQPWLKERIPNVNLK